jgi:hypothetical protein
MKTFTASLIFQGKVVQEQELQAESLEKAQKECADSLDKANEDVSGSTKLLNIGKWIEVKEKIA